MSEAHECIVGLVFNYDESELVTLRNLKEHIINRRAMYEWCKENYVNGMQDGYCTLADYADGRKSTDLYRFEYCPICGKRIGWKKIRQEAKTVGGTWEGI